MRRKETSGHITYLEMDREQLVQLCRDWAYRIRKEFQPDCVIFVAKSGFIAGKVFSEVFRCPLLEISAERKGSSLKKLLAPVLKRLIPGRILFRMLSSRKSIQFHEKESERSIIPGKDLLDYTVRMQGQEQKILIVDDSIDTGHTALQITDKVKELIPGSEIRFAGICKLHESEKHFHTDYCLYTDTIIFTVTSRLSKDYGSFLREYERWRNSGGSR